MATTITIANEKGGVGKTTTAVNLAAGLALRLSDRADGANRVLLVDMDPQGQAGKSLGFYVRDLAPNVYDLLLDPALPVEAVIRPSQVPNLDVICSNKRLSDFPVEAAPAADRERRLAKKLEGLGRYDFVLVDSPPSAGLLTTNILLSVEEVVVPVNLTYFALDGCAEIVESVERMRRDFGKAVLDIVLVVPTLYRPTRLAEEILEKLRTHFPERTARTVIGYNVKIDEAQSHGKTIWDYAAWSPGAAMLESLSKEIWRAKQP